MMKPSTPGTGAQTGPNGFVSGSDDTSDYFPHIGTVHVHAYYNVSSAGFVLWNVIFIF